MGAIRVVCADCSRLMGPRSCPSVPGPRAYVEGGGPYGPQGAPFLWPLCTPSPDPLPGGLGACQAASSAVGTLPAQRRPGMVRRCQDSSAGRVSASAVGAGLPPGTPPPNLTPTHDLMRMDKINLGILMRPCARETDGSSEDSVRKIATFAGSFRTSFAYSVSSHYEGSLRYWREWGGGLRPGRVVRGTWERRGLPRRPALSPLARDPACLPRHLPHPRAPESRCADRCPLLAVPEPEAAGQSLLHARFSWGPCGNLGRRSRTRHGAVTLKFSTVEEHVLQTSGLKTMAPSAFSQPHRLARPCAARAPRSEAPERALAAGGDLGL